MNWSNQESREGEEREGRESTSSASTRALISCAMFAFSRVISSSNAFMFEVANSLSSTLTSATSSLVLGGVDEAEGGRLRCGRGGGRRDAR